MQQNPAYNHRAASNSDDDDYLEPNFNQIQVYDDLKGEYAEADEVRPVAVPDKDAGGYVEDHFLVGQTAPGSALYAPGMLCPSGGLSKGQGGHRRRRSSSSSSSTARGFGVTATIAGAPLTQRVVSRPHPTLLWKKAVRCTTARRNQLTDASVVVMFCRHLNRDRLHFDIRRQTMFLHPANKVI